MDMSTNGWARLAGLFYLAVAVAGGFSEYVRTSTTVAGDAAATAANVAGHTTLFRVAFAADLADLPLFLGVGIILYALMRPVSPPVALAMLVLNAVSVAIQGLNMLNHAGALLAAGDPQLILLFLNLHHVGYLIAQIFFGLYLLPLGYLVYRSELFPRALGVILMIGCGGYLAGIAVSFAAADFQSSLATYFGLVGGLAEMLFLVWLLVKGLNTRGSKSIQGAPTWAA